MSNKDVQDAQFYVAAVSTLVFETEHDEHHVVVLLRDHILCTEFLTALCIGLCLRKRSHVRYLRVVLT